MQGLDDCRVRSALVNPPDVLRAGYGEDDAAPPLGIGYIAAVLRANGFAADLFDLAHFDLRTNRSTVVDRLEEANFFSYDVYGFTAYTKTFLSAVDVVSLVRER